MITMQLKQLLIIKQILFVSTFGNVQETVWRICIQISGCKGLLLTCEFYIFVIRSHLDLNHQEQRPLQKHFMMNFQITNLRKYMFNVQVHPVLCPRYILHIFTANTLDHTLYSLNCQLHYPNDRFKKLTNFFGHSLIQMSYDLKSTSGV